MNAASASSPAPSSAPAPSSSVPPAGQKLSFHERRELDVLEARIEAGEARKADLEAALSAPSSDFSAVQTLADELATLTAALDADLERWTDLAERA